MRKRRASLCPVLDQLDDRCLLSSATGALSVGYAPGQILSAYGLNAITFASSSSGSPVKGDGSGETIAVIELNSDPNIQSDVNIFDAQYDLPSLTLNVVNNAGNQTDSGWSMEQALDVEWAHAIAPGASILLVQAAPSSSASQELQNLLAAVDTARNTPGVVAVSMSWGFSEMPDELLYDSHFTTPAGHAGVTFIAASGDDGIVEYPATSPDVVAVGGTTLDLSATGAYGSETGWSDSSGGYSQYEREPSYQSSAQQTGMRSSPDVAFDGDPNTGVEVYSTDPKTGQGTWQIVGGTSLGAPVWTAIIAIVDQGRAVAGEASLDGSTQTLPALYAAPSTKFDSVVPAPVSSPIGGGFAESGFDPFGSGTGNTVGSNTTAGATANTSTGLGSLMGSPLVADLVASTLTTPLTTIGIPTVENAPATSRSARHHRKHHKKAAVHPVKRCKRHGSPNHKPRLVTQEQSRKPTTPWVALNPFFDTDPARPSFAR
jgi:subtilase family serine protease